MPSNTIVETAIDWIERERLPDPIVRAGIRRLCVNRRRREMAGNCEDRLAREQAFIAAMDNGPIAPVPDKANAQHYELPAGFFRHVLGKQLKYSGCLFDNDSADLDQAEARSLEVTAEHAGLENGQAVLELGCGWGSLTLWMGAQYPASTITALSNSAVQREFIEEQAAAAGLNNIQVVTADINTFEPEAVGFDRVVSIEMFEHMRNWRELLARIRGWLRPGGRLLVHTFCHRDASYAFETEGSADWMGRHFFTGGIMPADGLMRSFQNDLRHRGQWRWNGRHYSATANAWLANLDQNREQVMPLLESAYGADARRWFQRWRVFFMACAELFGLHQGDAWWVVHHLMERPEQDL